MIFFSRGGFLSRKLLPPRYVVGILLRFHMPFEYAWMYLKEMNCRCATVIFMFSHCLIAPWSPTLPVPTPCFALQVESNLTQLRVSSDGEGRPALGRRINSLDLEAAADKLLEARSSFIS